MASSLLALLSQQAPIQTRKGLILTGLQNDFLSPDGKLPVSTTSGFLDRLKELVTEFRQYGDLIWIRSHFEENRAVNQQQDSGDSVVVKSKIEANDEPAELPKELKSTLERPPEPSSEGHKAAETVNAPVKAEEFVERRETGHPGLIEEREADEELFLTKTTTREPCCIPGSTGAEYATQIKDLVDDKDLQIIKTYYSAFASTSLLGTLRGKLVTELFICGCMTNLSVFATAMDAARFGIKITLVEDCLGYRRRDRHDEAIKQLRDIMEARVKTSSEVIESLRNPMPSPEDEPSEEGESDEADIVVGEEADGIPANLLEPDSDESDEDAVRLPTLFSVRMLDVRPSSQSTTANELQPTSTVEPRKPTDTRAADAGCTPDDRLRANSDSSERTGHGKRENDLECGLTGSSGEHGLAAGDESPKRIKRYELFDGSVKPQWHDQERNTHLSHAQLSYPPLAVSSALAGPDQTACSKYEGMVIEEPRDHVFEVAQQQNRKALFGDGREKESGGSSILHTMLPPELAETIFDLLNDEITWEKMHHQTGEVPRLVCCQGTFEEDGGMPVYRHPSDQTLPIHSWTPAVDKVRRVAEEVVGHRLNHALIQLYRSGNDYISEHSDKTLDIAEGSLIVNVSFGAQRTMRLRTKRAGAAGEGVSSIRTTYRVPMPHNSMIMMALPTNAEYLHGINADKRPGVELLEAEKAFGGQRISLTFRNISTYLTFDSSRIWGQGATAKAKDNAKLVINSNAVESERLVRAFGAENQASKTDRQSFYGEGFDVLHLK